jgi:hypothetical protein
MYSCLCRWMVSRYPNVIEGGRGRERRGGSSPLISRRCYECDPTSTLTTSGLDYVRARVILIGLRVRLMWEVGKTQARIFRRACRFDLNATFFSFKIRTTGIWDIRCTYAHPPRRRPAFISPEKSTVSNLSLSKPPTHHAGHFSPPLTFISTPLPSLTIYDNTGI